MLEVNGWPYHKFLSVFFLFPIEPLPACLPACLPLDHIIEEIVRSWQVVWLVLLGHTHI